MKTTISLILSLLLIAFNTLSSLADIPDPVIKASTDTDSLELVYAPADLPANPDEAYIDDIPFDTRTISRAYLERANPQLKVESYVNDIPFNTESVAVRFLPLRKLGITATQEKYINDIPFDTAKIAAFFMRRQLNGGILSSK